MTLALFSKWKQLNNCRFPWQYVFLVIHIVDSLLSTFFPNLIFPSNQALILQQEFSVQIGCFWKGALMKVFEGLGNMGHLCSNSSVFSLQVEIKMVKRTASFFLGHSFRKPCNSSGGLLILSVPRG